MALVPAASAVGRISPMDDRRARNHARDLQAVLDAMPSMASWEPAVTTHEILRAIRLPERRVLTLLHELHAEGFAVEVGGRWRRRRLLPPPAADPSSEA